MRAGISSRMVTSRKFRCRRTKKAGWSDYGGRRAWFTEWQKKPPFAAKIVPPLLHPSLALPRLSCDLPNGFAAVIDEGSSEAAVAVGLAYHARAARRVGGTRKKRPSFAPTHQKQSRTYSKARPARGAGTAHRASRRATHCPLVPTAQGAQRSPRGKIFRRCIYALREALTQNCYWLVRL